VARTGPLHYDWPRREGSLHRVVSDLTRKHVAIERLRFKSGSCNHRLHLDRAPVSRLDHATAVLRNDVGVRVAAPSRQ